MDEYPTYCTIAQSKKALEFGASIKEANLFDFPVNIIAQTQMV